MKKFLLFISFCLLCLTQMSAATETWVKVTEEPTDWSGDYLIVYETGKKAFDGSLTTLDVTQNFKDVTILNNSITTTDCNFYFTIAAVSGGYSIKSKSGYYIGRTATSNGFNSSKTEQYSHTITLSGGIKSSGGPKLQYYNSGNSSKFRYYKTTQNPVALYKKQEGAVATPAKAVFTNEVGETVIGGDVNQGSYITCTWDDGCTAKITINDVEQTVDEGSTSYTWYADESYAAGAEVTIVVEVTNEYNKTSTATAKFTVVSPYKVVDVITVDNLTLGDGYTNFTYAGEGAVYAGRCQSLNGIYINYNTTITKNAHGAAFFMTESVGVVSKITLNLHSANGNVYVYGKNEPYEAYAGTAIPTDKAYMYSESDPTLGTKIGESVTGTTIKSFENPQGFKYIMIISDGGASFKSITFEWEDAYAGGKDVTYEKQTETTHLTAGKFVTLVDTQNGKAVSRKGAVEGTISGAAVTVESNAIALSKAQFSVDEFELVPVDGGFKLYGGGSITRRYIAYDDATTGLTTTENASEAKVVTFVSYGTGIIVKFAENKFLVSDGTNFGIGAVSTETPASLATGATLVPAYVFVSEGKDSTGVEDIETAETEAPAQYYNLNGVEVKADNLVPGIYIVRQGNKVSKHLIR